MVTDGEIVTLEQVPVAILILSARGWRAPVGFKVISAKAAKGQHIFT